MAASFLRSLGIDDSVLVGGGAGGGGASAAAAADGGGGGGSASLLLEDESVCAAFSSHFREVHALRRECEGMRQRQHDQGLEIAGLEVAERTWDYYC